MAARGQKEVLVKMKKNKTTLFLALLCVWSSVFVGFRYSQQIRNILPVVFVQVFDKDKPSAATSLRNSQPEILTNWSDLVTAINQDHEFVNASAGVQSGKHEVITFQEEAAAGASSTNEGHLQVIDGGSQPEMAFTSEDGVQLQFTKDGDLFSSAGFTVSGTSTFNGSITLGAGDDLIGSATSDITFNTNKFTVAGATGNTVVAGTLDVTGNIDPTTYETTNGGFLDEDAMGSDAADKVASQQSIKAYVDAGNAYIKISDVKSQNTDGGGFTSGSWQTRTLNTEDTDTGSLAALSSNQITLSAGTYECRISCPAIDVDRHQTRLRNTTGGTTLLTGTSEFSISGGASDVTRSFIVGRFTVAGSQALEVQHQGGTTQASNGFGEASNFGSEVYTIAEFWKR